MANDSEIGIATCAYCGQEMRPTDYLERLRAECERLRQELMQVASALNDADVPQEVHVEGGMAFTGLRARIAFLADRAERAEAALATARKEVEFAMEELWEGDAKERLRQVIARLGGEKLRTGSLPPVSALEHLFPPRTK